MPGSGKGAAPPKRGAGMIVFPALPVRNPCVGIVFHRKVFSLEECRRIAATAVPERWEEGMVGGHQGAGVFSEVPNTRSCRQQRLPVAQTGFPIDRICAEICQANSSGWQFQLSGFVGDDMPWLMRYDEGGRGHYDWHVDLGQSATASRKLGFTLQLTDGADYDGGDLEFYNLGVDPAVLREIGTLIVFPSYWMHRVATVTRGSRLAAVGWVHGPSFR